MRRAISAAVICDSEVIVRGALSPMDIPYGSEIIGQGCHFCKLRLMIRGLPTGCFYGILYFVSGVAMRR